MLDILSGSYSRNGQPMAGLFQVLWGEPGGTFQAAEALAGTDGEQLAIPPAEDEVPNTGMGIIESICTRPFAVDWDADGDLDLVVGNFSGNFYLFHGEGDGKFLSEPEPLQFADGKTLKIVGQHSDPFVIDWDGDGDLDLLSGSSSGGVQWAENLAGDGNPPKIGPFEFLVKASKQREPGGLITEDNLTGPTTSTRVWVADVNTDGKLDLVVGDNITLTSPAPGLTESEYREKHEAWSQEMQKASEEYSKLLTEVQSETTEEPEDTSETEAEASNESSNVFGTWLKSLLGVESESAKQETSKLDKASKRISTLYEQKSAFMQGDSTGFVWLYLQK